MAKNASVFAKMALTLSLLLMVASMGESRSMFTDALRKANPVVTCDQVTGVATGDDCTTISQSFKLTLQSFLAINPNINCASMFVGQWVCVDGIVTN